MTQIRALKIALAGLLFAALSIASHAQSQVEFSFERFQSIGPSVQ